MGWLDKMGKTLTAGAFVLIALILSGAYTVTELNKDKTYFCSANQLVGISIILMLSSAFAYG